MCTFILQLTRNTLFFGGGVNLFYLKAIEGDKQPQDVVGALEDSEYSQISHHSLHSGILQGNDTGSSPGSEIPTGRKAAEQVKQKSGQVLLKLQRDISILVNCEMMQLLHFPSFLPSFLLDGQHPTVTFLNNLSKQKEVKKAAGTPASRRDAVLFNHRLHGFLQIALFSDQIAFNCTTASLTPSATV